MSQWHRSISKRARGILQRWWSKWSYQILDYGRYAGQAEWKSSTPLHSTQSIMQFTHGCKDQKWKGNLKLLSHTWTSTHTWVHPGWSLWLVFLFSRYASQVWIRSQGKSSLTKSAVSPESGNLVKERFQNGFHVSSHQVRYASIGWNTHWGGGGGQSREPVHQGKSLT